MKVKLDGKFFAEWHSSLEELAEFSDVDVSRLSFDEEDLAKKLRKDKKDKREADIKVLTVTTAAGNTYDADEASQDRMVRAISALGNDNIKWTMADNKTKMVNVTELKEALLLAVRATESMWDTDTAVPKR